MYRYDRSSDRYVACSDEEGTVCFCVQALDFNRLKEIKKERAPPPTAELLMAKMITPDDRNRKPTNEELIVAKYRNAPRHDRVGAGGIMGRMKRNAVVVRKIDRELAENRKEEETIV